MTVVEPAIGPIEEILQALDPDLNRAPSFMPTPDPPINLGAAGKRISWSDVFDAASQKVTSIVAGGTPIGQPSFLDLKNGALAALGQSIAAVGGFTEQIAAALAQVTAIVDGGFANTQSNELTDFRNLSQRLDQIQAHNDYIDQYVVPALHAQILHAEAFAYSTALAAQGNAEAYARENIFAPLYTEILKVQPAIDASAQSVTAKIPEIVKQMAPGIIAPALTAVATLAAKVASNTAVIDECAQPMCDTMGPKTNLGKFLKALSIAADASLLAELAALNESQLAALVTSLADKGASYIGFFENNFLTGGKSIGTTITDAISANL